MNFEFFENPGKEWDAFVTGQTTLPFWGSRWARVLQEGLRGKCYCFTLKSGMDIVGGMSGVLLAYGWTRLLYCSIPYGGYLGDRSHFDLFMESFVAKTSFADMVYISPPVSEPGGGYAKYFEASSEVATRIDLGGKTLHEVQSAFAPSVRQSFNKGARLDLQFRRCQDRGSFLIAHRLYLETMRRNRAIARYPERWFAAIHSNLAMVGEASVYLVYSGDLPIAATVVIESLQGRHLLHSGSSTEHLFLRANDQIVGEIVKDAIKEGKEYVDFMLSDPADTALIRWKEKFGGHSLTLNKYRRINRPLKHALWQGAKKIAPLLGSFRLLSGSGQT